MSPEAVFAEDVIRHHQQFITHRRALRDSDEYRHVTPEEWTEFEKALPAAPGRTRAQIAAWIVEEAEQQS
ncbi:hypothetical protein ACIBG0_05285 [Nocardia sp. NPDC050630]|uniref:hypothetical protein n=1 Tax=Nocardia sp. NPDC050630 TaxID=3364321 RepID=UPI0037A766AD